MSHWQDDDDEDDDVDEADDADRLSAAELPDPADTDPPADDQDTVPCPFCGRAVYEFADVCPKCHNFIGGSDDPSRSRRPLWVTVAVLACLAGMIATSTWWVLRMW